MIINFHNITSEPLDEFDRHAAPRLDVHAFTRIIDWLSERFAIVSLETMLDRLSQGESIDGLATLTFDDGHLGILLNALQALCRCCCQTCRAFLWQRTRIAWPLCATSNVL